MEVYPVLWLIVAVISLLPMYVFWIGYRKLRTRDLLITAIAFTLFFIKAALIAMEIFIEGNESSWILNDEFWLAVAAILDMAIIGLIATSFTIKLGNGDEPSLNGKLAVGTEESFGDKKKDSANDPGEDKEEPGEEKKDLRPEEPVDPEGKDEP